MRRIKLVVSDFHMGFGRLTADGMLNDLEDFVSDRAFIDLLEYYRTGEYVDAEVEMVLNGDVFECLSTVDLSDPEPDVITVDKSLDRIGRIIDGHPALFAALRRFAEAPQHTVTFIAGNHDQDLLWEQAQSLLRERIHPAVRVLKTSYYFDGVHIEHGHQYESHNYLDPRRIFLTKGLEQPIMNLSWGSDMFINCLLRYKRLRPYVNRVRPMRLALIWTLFHDFRALLKGSYFFANAIFRARFRRNRQRRIGFLTTLRLFFSHGGWAALEQGAKRLLRSQSIHTVVLGHSHIPTWRQLLPGKTYINCGAWIPTSNLHVSALGWSLLQTFAYIEYEDGVPRGRLKLWHGRRLVEEEIVL